MESLPFQNNLVSLLYITHTSGLKSVKAGKSFGVDFYFLCV